MEIVNVGNVVIIIVVGVISWVVKDIISNIREKAVNDRKELCDSIKELDRKNEKLEMKFHEFENEKYNKIMEALSGIKADVAVIKNEIDNLKQRT